MIKFLFTCLLLTNVKTQFQDLGAALKMMKDMNNVMNNIGTNDDGSFAQGRHFQKIVTLGSDGSETTQTIETINTPDGIPITHVTVVKKNLKVGEGGPRINPIQMFSGNFS
jgi:hypothetical protein